MKLSVRSLRVQSGLKALGLALALLMPLTLGYSQSDNNTDNQQTPSSSPPSNLKAVLPNGSKKVTPNLGAGSFTAYCTYRSWGAGDFYCWDSAINANSRVFASVSEYSTTPDQRFQGAAVMTIHNVIPHNGYVAVYIDTGWTAYPINIRLDLLVDP
jgi:hypothetical protein